MGGLLRRGLAMDRAAVACVTNIASDHLGEYGVNSLDELAKAKLLVARGLRHGRPLVLNADIAELRGSRRLDHGPHREPDRVVFT